MVKSAPNATAVDLLNGVINVTKGMEFRDHLFIFTIALHF